MEIASCLALPIIQTNFAKLISSNLHLPFYPFFLLEYLKASHRNLMPPLNTSTCTIFNWLVRTFFFFNITPFTPNEIINSSLSYKTHIKKTSQICKSCHLNQSVWISFIQAKHMPCIWPFYLSKFKSPVMILSFLFFDTNNLPRNRNLCPVRCSISLIWLAVSISSWCILTYLLY